MNKKQDKDPAETKAEQLKKMAVEADKLGALRGALAQVRGLIGSDDPVGKIIVLYNDGEQHDRSLYGSARDYWSALGSEKLELSTPILGALETTLREQIRKQETVLREMGVTDF